MPFFFHLHMFDYWQYKLLSCCFFMNNLRRPFFLKQRFTHRDKYQVVNAQFHGVSNSKNVSVIRADFLLVKKIGLRKIELEGKYFLIILVNLSKKKVIDFMPIFSFGLYHNHAHCTFIHCLQTFKIQVFEWRI